MQTAFHFILDIILFYLTPMIELPFIAKSGMNQPRWFVRFVLIFLFVRLFVLDDCFSNDVNIFVLLVHTFSNVNNVFLVFPMKLQVCEYIITMKRMIMNFCTPCDQTLKKNVVSSTNDEVLSH